MELLLRLPLEGYEVKEYPDTRTILVVKKGVRGEPDYSLEGDGFVIEFKNGEVYTIDIYEPEVAQRFREKHLLSVR